MKTTNETSPFKIKGFDSAGTMDEFIAYVEQFDLSGPVWIHEEFHGAHTYWFDESESANVPTVGGVRVDKARMFVDDAGDAMILLGFYDRCSEELSEHKLGEPLTKKARVLFAVLENAFGPHRPNESGSSYVSEPQGLHSLEMGEGGFSTGFHDDDVPWVCDTTICLQTQYSASRDTDYDDI